MYVYMHTHKGELSPACEQLLSLALALQIHVIHQHKSLPAHTAVKTSMASPSNSVQSVAVVHLKY
jgi:hypothetical protein